MMNAESTSSEIISALMEKLFSYGTLKLAKTQKSLFGRVLEGRIESLAGYKIENLKINDQSVIQESGMRIHPILVFSGKSKNIVSGTVFEITEEELRIADSYEVEDYERVLVTMISGTEAWVYIANI